MHPQNFGSNPAPTGIEGFSVAVLITYTACGVLLGFLVTRLVLQGAFHRADLRLYDEKLNQVQQSVTGLQSELQTLTSQLLEKGTRERNVIDTISGWLSSDAPGTPETVNEIKEKVQAASPSTKTAIFLMARSEAVNARKHVEEVKKRKVIPVIEALNAGMTQIGSLIITPFWATYIAT